MHYPIDGSAPLYQNKILKYYNTVRNSSSPYKIIPSIVDIAQDLIKVQYPFEIFKYRLLKHQPTDHSWIKINNITSTFESESLGFQNIDLSYFEVSSTAFEEYDMLYLKLCKPIYEKHYVKLTFSLFSNETNIIRHKIFVNLNIFVIPLHYQA